jgi:hypothetical protein
MRLKVGIYGWDDLFTNINHVDGWDVLFTNIDHVMDGMFCLQT